MTRLPSNMLHEKQWFYFDFATKQPYIFISNSKAKKFCRRSQYFNPSVHLHTYYKAEEILLSNLNIFPVDNLGFAYYLQGSKYAFIDVDNAFMDGSTTLRHFFSQVCSKAQDSAIFYSVSYKGLHIPVLKTIGLKQTSNELAKIESIDTDTKFKEPKIEYFTDIKGTIGRYMCLTGNSFNGKWDITLTENDIHGLYEIFRKKEQKAVKRTIDKLYTGNSNIEAILSNIDIEDVLSDYIGFSENLDKKCWCPFHKGSEPSLQRFKKHPNKVVCYSTSCQAGIETSSGFYIIDSINIVQFAKGFNKAQAIKELKDRYLQGGR
jgi:hypothetical protein